MTSAARIGEAYRRSGLEKFDETYTQNGVDMNEKHSLKDSRDTGTHGVIYQEGLSQKPAFTVYLCVCVCVVRHFPY